MIDGLQVRVEEAERDLRRLSDTVRRLDSDLDESRRLNLRAAELLDIVLTDLSTPK